MNFNCKLDLFFHVKQCRKVSYKAVFLTPGKLNSCTPSPPPPHRIKTQNIEYSLTTSWIFNLIYGYYHFDILISLPVFKNTGEGWQEGCTGIQAE